MEVTISMAHEGLFVCTPVSATVVQASPPSAGQSWTLCPRYSVTKESPLAVNETWIGEFSSVEAVPATPVPASRSRTSLHSVISEYLKQRIHRWRQWPQRRKEWTWSTRILLQRSHSRSEGWKRDSAEYDGCIDQRSRGRQHHSPRSTRAAQHPNLPCSFQPWYTQCLDCWKDTQSRQSADSHFHPKQKLLARRVPRRKTLRHHFLQWTCSLTRTLGTAGLDRSRNLPRRSRHLLSQLSHIDGWIRSRRIAELHTTGGIADQAVPTINEAEDPQPLQNNTQQDARRPRREVWPLWRKEITKKMLHFWRDVFLEAITIQIWMMNFLWVCRDELIADQSEVSEMVSEIFSSAQSENWSWQQSVDQDNKRNVIRVYAQVLTPISCSFAVHAWSLQGFFPAYSFIDCCSECLRAYAPFDRSEEIISASRTVVVKNCFVNRSVPRSHWWHISFGSQGSTQTQRNGAKGMEPENIIPSGPPPHPHSPVSWSSEMKPNPKFNLLCFSGSIASADRLFLTIRSRQSVFRFRGLFSCAFCSMLDSRRVRLLSRKINAKSRFSFYAFCGCVFVCLWLHWDQVTFSAGAGDCSIFALLSRIFSDDIFSPSWSQYLCFLRVFLSFCDCFVTNWPSHPARLVAARSTLMGPVLPLALFDNTDDFHFFLQRSSRLSHPWDLIVLVFKDEPISVIIGRFIRAFDLTKGFDSLPNVWNVALMGGYKCRFSVVMSELTLDHDPWSFNCMSMFWNFRSVSHPLSYVIICPTFLNRVDNVDDGFSLHSSEINLSPLTCTKSSVFICNFYNDHHCIDTKFKRATFFRIHVHMWRYLFQDFHLSIIMTQFSNSTVVWHSHLQKMSFFLCKFL